jgi:hypothetical protein
MLSINVYHYKFIICHFYLITENLRSGCWCFGFLVPLSEHFTKDLLVCNRFSNWEIYLIQNESWIVLIAILNLIQRSQNPYVRTADFVTIAEISPVSTMISIRNESHPFWLMMNNMLTDVRGIARLRCLPLV